MFMISVTLTLSCDQWVTVQFSKSHMTFKNGQGHLVHFDFVKHGRDCHCAEFLKTLLKQEESTHKGVN